MVLPVNSSAASSAASSSAVVSSAASSAASSTTATTTAPRLPLEMSLANLKGDAQLEKLWKEKVTDVNFFLKLFGAISYLWNKHSIVQSVAEFKTATEALVDAVAARKLSTSEITQHNFAQPLRSETDLKLELIATEKLDAFYSAFKSRFANLVTSLKVNQNEFGVYAAAATTFVSGLAPRDPDMKVKLETTRQVFSERIFVDMINGYANQPIANLTPDSFNQTVANIQAYFTQMPTVAIEVKLNQAIRNKHAQALPTILGEFANPAVDSARFVAVKNALKAKLDAEKTELTTQLTAPDIAVLQAEINALRGTTGFNGTINAARDAKITAQGEMEQAKAAYITVRAAFGTAAQTNATNAELLGLQDVDPRIAQAKDAFRLKVEAFVAAQTAHKKLEDRLTEIADFTLVGTNNRKTGSINAKIALINASLDEAQLVRNATAEMARNATFFNAFVI